jgi:hypothetical protein
VHRTSQHDALLGNGVKHEVGLKRTRYQKKPLVVKKWVRESGVRPYARLGRQQEVHALQSIKVALGHIPTSIRGIPLVLRLNVSEVGPQS